MPKISACVVAYNRAAILKSCLHSLQFADDLVVVDLPPLVLPAGSS